MTIGNYAFLWGLWVVLYTVYVLTWALWLTGGGVNYDGAD